VVEHMPLHPRVKGLSPTTANKMINGRKNYAKSGEFDLKVLVALTNNWLGFIGVTGVDVLPNFSRARSFPVLSCYSFHKQLTRVTYSPKSKL
jgi:hypothetical protein